jgi:hypothetical protein
MKKHNINLDSSSPNSSSHGYALPASGFFFKGTYNSSSSNVYFYLVQLISENIFLIKHKIYNGTHAHYTDILP